MEVSDFYMTTRFSKLTFSHAPDLGCGIIDILANGSRSKNGWRRRIWSLADYQRRGSAKRVLRFGFNPLDQVGAGGDIMNQSDDLASSPHLDEILALAVIG